MALFPYTPFPFNVTPASPSFDLTPIASNTSQGWVPSCSTPECIPTASWSTSLIGAALSFQFWGWDVAFEGNVKGNMSIELFRDGKREKWDPSTDTLFRLYGQPADQMYSHSLTLRVLDASPDAELTINQAQVNGSSLGDDYMCADRWILPSDDTNLNYEGFVPQTSQAQDGSQTTFMSSRAGDTLSMRFNGSTFLLHGPCGPTSGLIKVTVDGRESTVNTTKPLQSNNCLLFQAWALSVTNEHQLTIENIGNATLGIDKFDFFRLDPYRGRFKLSCRPLNVVPMETVSGVGAVMAVVLVLVGFGVYRLMSKRGKKVVGTLKALCL